MCYGYTMNTMNPTQVARAHRTRLVREAQTPVWTSTRESEEARLISRAERLACGEEFCHICKRATEHFGEHSDEQILRWAKTPSMVQSLL